jgi:hypothetical protein
MFFKEIIPVYTENHTDKMQLITVKTSGTHNCHWALKELDALHVCFREVFFMLC